MQHATIRPVDKNFPRRVQNLQLVLVSFGSKLFVLVSLGLYYLSLYLQDLYSLSLYLWDYTLCPCISRI